MPQQEQLSQFLAGDVLIPETGHELGRENGFDFIPESQEAVSAHQPGLTWDCPPGLAIWPCLFADASQDHTQH